MSLHDIYWESPWEADDLAEAMADEESKPKVEPRVPGDLMGMPLSPREREVAGLIVEGSTTRQIAHALAVSIATINTHRARIFLKLGIHNKKDIQAAMAAESGKR